MLHPESALRLLDRLDCLGGALRLAWMGQGGRWLYAVALTSGLMIGFVAAGLPPP